MNEYESVTRDLCEFIAGAPSCYHVISQGASLLEKQGFQRLSEQERWEIKPGKSYYVIRSGSSLLDGGEKPKAEKKAAKPAQKEKETDADKAVKQNLKASKKGPAQAQNAPVSRAANAPAAAKTPNKGADIAAVRENALKEEKPAKPLAPAKDVDEKPLRDVLNAIFAKLDITADINIDVNKEERTVNITVVGEDTGELIGKKGQTLDAVQYILSIIVNKDQDSYFRVKLDTNNYRERRQKTLENLARNMAAKVKKTHRKVTLEPMNPYERRVIHAYLQSDKLVTTKSEGEEPNRRVVIYYKK